MVWPAIISAIGGLIGQGMASGSNIDARRYEDVQNQIALDMARHGIKYRVEDAISAGVHPLFALGAQTPTYSPSVSAGDSAPGRIVAETARNVGEALTRRDANALQVAAQEIANRNAAAGQAKDYAQASYYDAMAAKVRQDSMGIAAPAGAVEDTGVVQTFRVQPQEVIQGRDLGGSMYLSDAAGRNVGLPGQEKPYIARQAEEQMWMRVNVGANFQVLFPKATDPAESLESMGELGVVGWLPFIQANIDEFGVGWLAKARKAFINYPYFGQAVSRYLGLSR